MIASSGIKHDLTDRQTVAQDAMRDASIKAVMYGGAKGGGKSWFLCVEMFHWALQVIANFGIEPSEHPPHIAWIGRKQAVDFTATTLQTWQRVIPAEYYTIKSGTEKHPKHILIRDAVAIDFGGLDRREDINRFNSAEYGRLAIDQAEETTKDEVSVLRASLRLKINDRDLDFHELYTANPAPCWLKSDFIDAPEPRHLFVQALCSDNPHLPSDYPDTLRRAFKHRPELLAAYLDGSWDSFDADNQCVKSIDVREAMARVMHIDQPRKVLVTDVARMGDDETVIYGLHETQIVEEHIFGQKRAFFVANQLHRLAIEGGYHVVAIERPGPGDGVHDALEPICNGEYEIMVIDVSSAAEGKPDAAIKYYNRRAEVWDEGAKMFSDGDVCLQPWETHDGTQTRVDPVLTSQLCTPTYSFRPGNRLLIESKDDLKKRIGRSPDRADAYMLGLYALRRTARDIVHAHSERARGRDRRPMRGDEAMDPMTI